MGKKAKRGIKKRNESKSNRPANQKSSETKQTPTPTESHPTPTQQKSQTQHEKKSLSWKVVGLFSSLIILVLGFLGYGALWPKVTIDVSPAVASNFLSYQFTFANQACYPIKVVSTRIEAIHLSWPGNDVKNLGFMRNYTGIQIDGRESITMKFDNFKMTNTNKLDEGSIIIIKITYRLPLLKIDKTDSALFEVARDNGGNPIWVKRPLGKYANYEALSILFYDPPDPQTGIF
jgi:hypothetical protein